MDMSSVDNAKYFFQKFPIKDLIAGGCCGLAVDSFLFPVDTCKTRLQSENGFREAGGFRGIYNGVLPVIAASIPIAAIFFCVYESVQQGFTISDEKTLLKLLINVLAASLGEMFAGLIRVPIEIVKQKRQTNKVHHRAIDILMHAYKSEGLINGIYKGYGITIMRDIPFSIIQYPLWESLKAITKYSTQSPPFHNLNPFVDACLGSIAGATASAITTPLDVAKTRIQLADLESDSENCVKQQSPCHIWQTLYKEKGLAGVYSGFVPRVLWTTIGGFIWFGTYSFVNQFLESL